MVMNLIVYSSLIVTDCRDRWNKCDQSLCLFVLFWPNKNHVH